MAHSLIQAKRNCLSLLLGLALIFFTSLVMAEDHALVIRGKAVIFEEVLKGISDDVEDEISLVDMVITKKSSSREIDKMFARYNPRLVILIGNKAVNLYGDFQSKNKSMDFPPAIAMAALLSMSLPAG